jgi:hypothetical protein
MKLELLTNAKEKLKDSQKEEKKNCIYPHIILTFSDFVVKKISI